MGRLNIQSDFTDFYDSLAEKNSIITYNRFLSECKQRGTALKYLRSIGIKTIEIRQVNQFIMNDGPIVVYTNPKGHHSTGKEIMSVAQAMQSYGNCIASKYYASEDGLTAKYLQIGKRRFNLYYRKGNLVSLDMGTPISVNEIASEYNMLIGLPIFSIDYISNGTEMIATDFNEVENLARLGMDKYISAENTIEEIRQALEKYNKY